MGQFKEDRFEAEFLLDQPIEDVWTALQQENEREPAWLSAWPRFDSPTTGEVTLLEAPHRVEVHKHSEPCKDSAIAVSLEAAEGGTKVLVVQSGFPAWVKEALESFTIGGNQIVADLILYLERGVEISRHSMPWAFPGLTTQEVGTGLEVTAVMPGCFGERAGLQPGDLLMTLNGAPVFTQLGLQAMLRLLVAGDRVEASWVRGRELQQGAAAL